MRWEPFAVTALGAALAALLARGNANTRRLQVTRETVAVPGLLAAFEGCTLLHLTDLHLRAGSRWPERLLALIAETRPDIICLTGDYITRNVSLSELHALLAAIAETAPAFAVFGNADYREQLLTTAQRDALTRIVPFLRNAARPLERDGQQLWFAGVEDPHDGFADLPAALADVPPDAPVILLAHSPEIIAGALDPRIRLILSGHTHGGQICLPGGGAPYTNMRLPRRYVAGRHQLDGATLYVSRGIGSTRMPIRFNCLPEATVFTLTANGYNPDSQPPKADSP